MFRNKRGNKMTDEEKAEEYAENEQCANCSNPQYCQGKDECYDFANVKSHFLAGLEKENAELDCQVNRNKYCYSCANATDRCFRNEIGCPCEKYKSYKDENAELKEQIEQMKCCENCRYYSRTYEHCYSYDSYQNCKSLSNWRLAE